MSEPTTTTTTTATGEVVTGFRAAQIVNALLAEAGIDRVVKAQQIYQYVRKGTFVQYGGVVVVGTDKNGHDIVRIPLTTLAAWYKVFITGRAFSGVRAPVEDNVASVRALLG